jgi:hypothetical protein
MHQTQHGDIRGHGSYNLFVRLSEKLGTVFSSQTRSSWAMCMSLGKEVEGTRA